MSSYEKEKITYYFIWCDIIGIILSLCFDAKSWASTFTILVFIDCIRYTRIKLKNERNRKDES